MYLHYFHPSVLLVPLFLFRSHSYSFMTSFISYFYLAVLKGYSQGNGQNKCTWSYASRSISSSTRDEWLQAESMADATGSTELPFWTAGMKQRVKTNWMWSKFYNLRVYHYWVIYSPSVELLTFWNSISKWVSSEFQVIKYSRL